MFICLYLSVERLYNQLWQSGQPALEPLTICAQGGINFSIFIWALFLQYSPQFSILLKGFFDSNTSALFRGKSLLCYVIKFQRLFNYHIFYISNFKKKYYIILNSFLFSFNFKQQFSKGCQIDIRFILYSWVSTTISVFMKIYY